MWECVCVKVLIKTIGLSGNEVCMVSYKSCLLKNLILNVIKRYNFNCPIMDYLSNYLILAALVATPREIEFSWNLSEWISNFSSLFSTTDSTGIDRLADHDHPEWFTNWVGLNLLNFFCLAPKNWWFNLIIIMTNGGFLHPWIWLLPQWWFGELGFDRLLPILVYKYHHIHGNFWLFFWNKISVSKKKEGWRWYSPSHDRVAFPVKPSLHLHTKWPGRL